MNILSQKRELAAMNENELVKLAQETGDFRPINHLLERFRTVIFGVFRKNGVDSVDYDDVLQTVRLKIWKALNKFDFRGTFGGWLWRIASNAALDLKRTNKQRKRDVPIEEIYHMDDAGAMPQDIKLMYRETFEGACLIMEEFNPKRRAIFEAFLEGENYAQIAEEMNLPLGSVSSNIFLAREKMNEQLKV